MQTQKPKIIIPAIIIAVVIVGGAYFWRQNRISQPVTEIAEAAGVELSLSKDDLIIVSTPEANQVVTSPILIEGKARGTWFFEGSFPIKIEDSNGVTLGRYFAEAQSDWMTEDFVPFKASLTFDPSFTMNGTLILKKDNPSDLPADDDELRIPIAFGVLKTALRNVKLFYYNSANDSDSTGNIMCTRKGLESVDRNIPISMTPIQDAIQLLLKGDLTAAERAAGITTEYPLAGLVLENASLETGVLTLTFADPEGTTGGGSCRVGILWMQIEETAKQFPEVSSVRFLPEALFQP